MTDTAGTTPKALNVTANGGSLSPGTYSGIVTIIVPGAANSPLSILVTLSVGPPQLLSLSTANLTFRYQSGTSTTSPALAIQVASTGGSLPFTATTTALSGVANFLTVTPSNGTTPATLMIELNASVLATLSAGSYAGTITISSPNLLNLGQTVNVVLVVAPSLGAIVSGASLRPVPLLPAK